MHATYRPSSKETYFYSDHPEQQHLIKMVKNQRPRKNYTPKRKQSSTSPQGNYKKQRTFYRTPKPAEAFMHSPPRVAILSSSPKNTSHQESIKSLASEAFKEDKSIKIESVTMSNASESTIIVEDLKNVSKFSRGLFLISKLTFFRAQISTDVHLSVIISSTHSPRIIWAIQLLIRKMDFCNVAHAQMD